MKKFSTIALAVLLTSTMFGSYTAHADGQQIQEVSSGKEENATNYMKFTGVIQEVNKDENETRLTLENEKELIMIMRINDNTLKFNSGTTKHLNLTDLKIGATIEAYYDKNKPMILIYPATVTPEIVILKDEKVHGEVKIAKFDKNFLSLDNQLKLNIAKDTILLNQQGKKIKEIDLHDKELAIFYSATTKSIPAQTTPTKIIALDYLTEEMTKLQEIIAEDHNMTRGTKMIPLRKVAEHLGYHVLSQPKQKGVLVTLGNSSFTIKRDDDMYGYNKSIRKFEVAPELKGMKTYVSEEFLDLLIRN